MINVPLNLINDNNADCMCDDLMINIVILTLFNGSTWWFFSDKINGDVFRWDDRTGDQKNSSFSKRDFPATLDDNRYL